MELPPAECLLELCEQFSIHATPDERQWEYVQASPTTALIQPTSRPTALFRGQNARYAPSLTSLARGLATTPAAEISELDLLGLAKLADRTVRRIWFSNELKAHPAAQWFAEQRLEGFEFALAQHYGIPTGYMDLTESFDVACFFATCYVDNAGVWQPCTEGGGVIYMLSIDRIPIRPDALQPIGLQVLPRPREQFGWVIVCGINCDFEDIPGLQMFDFSHSESVSRYFLEKYSRGVDLFPPDATSAVAHRVMTSRAIPEPLANSVVADLCRQVAGFAGRVAEITATMVGELGLSLSNDLVVFDEQVRAQAKMEWAARRQDFLHYLHDSVGFRLVRSRPNGAA